MHVRLATHDDVAEIATVPVSAYEDDPQDAYMYPRRFNYPQLYIKAKASIARSALEDTTATLIVVTLDETDNYWDGTPTIVGFCIWYRETEYAQEAPDDQDGKDQGGSIFSAIKSYVLESEIVDYLSDLANPILSASHSRAMAQICSKPDSQQFVDGYEKPRYYHGVLDIGVDKGFQGRGVARLLMEWGMNRARTENLPVYLSATPAGKPLYLKLGFRTIGYWIWRPNQPEKWDIMQWDP
ncbi:unnamed protein product [Clonostachys byssicola]|uniref:N-acetyltransferase domain-containing protein n=1 Tax=Clonostachys byssicola TaxID=160290 RepID=A0A9N9Y4V8_9HYPO|nr:unnamed protein product [Clonostachys byssicola]